ncbi:MAG: adenylate kinase [Clostridia bacterium]|nr:adenylate kinase [Clostridia bacterium]
MTVRVVLLGPPGAGKGTQAERLARATGALHVATGDMFRQAVREATPLGRLAKSFMDRGELVPDDVTVGLVRERLSQEDAAGGFILDGFPRTRPQAEALDRLLSELGRPLTAVLELAVPDDEVVRRLSGRRVCEACGRNYHVEFDPPARPGVCDACGGRLVQRDDDREETVRRRLEVYRRDTLPLRDFYARRGLLRSVPASGRPEDVTRALLSAAGVEGA